MKKITVIIFIAVISFGNMMQSKASSITAMQDSTKTKIGFNKSFKFESERKVYENVQKIMDEPELEKQGKKVDVKYDMLGHPISKNITLAKMKPAEMDLPTYDRKGYGYLKAGFGTYISPLFEAVYNNKNASKYLFGFNVFHNSQFGNIKLDSGQKVGAPRSNTLVDLSSRFFLEESVLGVDVGYGNHFNSYYGYVGEVPSAILDDSQNPYHYGDRFSQNHASIGVTFKTEKPADKVSVNSAVKYTYLKTNYDQVENNVVLDLDLLKKFNKLYGGVDFQFVYDGLSNSSHAFPTDLAKDLFFRFVPNVSFRNDLFVGSVGIGVDGSFDSVFGNNILVYPEIHVDYDVLKGYMKLYLSLNGGIKNNSYSKMIFENSYINNSQRVMDSKEKLKMSFGMKGLFASIISYDAFVKYKVVGNEHYWGMQKYVEDNGVEVYDNRFNVFYQDINTTTLGLKLNAVLSKKTFVSAGFQYNNYSLDSDSLYYKPKFEFDVNGHFQVTPRLSLNSKVNFVGEQNGMVYSINTVDNGVGKENVAKQANNAVLIKSYWNIGVGAKYELPYNLTVYCDFENLLNQNYQKWLGYNENGFEFKLGATWNF
ncbi:hypothetical protein K4L44_11225 [Halosquirtibacter laminarini]|uniref:Uncharacterized protein n=1 Tax=Halosquirtibacter laminarini TaxID=3374600 RepID=A0AC61NMB6_9BACT|nr:hypothetical protein K4L44_11225 [Prolixibacteraceae bacterium]